MLHMLVGAIYRFSYQAANAPSHKAIRTLSEVFYLQASSPVYLKMILLRLATYFRAKCFVPINSVVHKKIVDLIYGHALVRLNVRINKLTTFMR